ncbi:unnamed protein product [Macrosiphum euphorbiae]|uniref:Abasic site processing protein HMCES n=1 Tax=Macrosiphum euphorbiae TaxID=13131 RepID=A0AAV0VY33_9HEMI|nr:unnamed protein product [Macrosiphum euphorbiae]
MCGRTACNLRCETYCKATSYKKRKDTLYCQPEWHDEMNGNFEFKQSNNIAPTDVTPILVSGEEFVGYPSRILTPMIWGMIPPWHKGNFNNHGLSTNNCRIENVTNSKLYSEPLTKGKRCIVICEGFYEWKTTEGVGKKKPYFIHMPQKNGVSVYDTNAWESAQWTEQSGWNGPSLLQLAGIYNKWKSPNGEVYSYSVITMESSKTFSQLHHRIPAVLDNEQLIEDWLDTRRVSESRAISMLRPIDNLMWYEVSSIVNNSRNKSEDCNKPISKIVNKSSTFMTSWLAGKNKKTDSSDEDQMKKKQKN